jgi:amino-acid N-acetyltransferase
VITDGREIMGCAELAPLSSDVAEVRSLVVDEQARGLGFGRLLVDTIADEARMAGFRTVCAFTHDPAYFVRLGYSLVPHAWLPEKIAHDCAGCTLFRQCGQDAVRLQLSERGPRA